MAQEFARSGIRIQYPDDWRIETEDTDEGWSSSFFSPGTAFVMLSHYPDDYAPAELADMALAAMRETYSDLESAEVVETVSDLPVVGHDVNFFALDLTNTSWIRGLSAPEGSLLMMSQCTDEELDDYGTAMRQIAESMTFEEEN